MAELLAGENAALEQQLAGMEGCQVCISHLCAHIRKEISEQLGIFVLLEFLEVPKQEINREIDTQIVFFLLAIISFLNNFCLSASGQSS